MSLYFGIDFGTSTNYVARWLEESGEVKDVDNMGIFGGPPIFPNVIYYGQNGEKVVGETAINKASIDPRNGIFGVKRKIVEDNWEYYIPALDSKYTPVDVSTDIFQYIKDKVSEQNGYKQIDGVVISVPYAYGNKERLKIRRAAERAGLNVIDLIEEPVAAAINADIFSKASTMGYSEKIMVFDFGGGTLDITIFYYEKNVDGQVTIEVLNTEGLRDFGGQVIDEILFSKITAKAGINVNEIINPVQRIHFQREMMSKVIWMKEFAQTPDWDDDIEGDFEDNLAGIPVKGTVTKKEMDEWLRGERVVEKIRDLVMDALLNCGDKGLDPDDIDRVLLVGGSSNLDIVKNTLRDIFGREPEKKENDIYKFVGKGAAKYCGLKVQNKNNFRIIQKLSYSIGVRVGANFDKLIEKNKGYGEFSKPRKYALSENKDNRDIEVYQGNSRDITRCFLIGKIPVSHLVLDENRSIELSLGTTETGMVAYKIYINGKCIDGVLE